VNIKIAGKWMFIPLKMVLIGIDPYPCGTNLDALVVDPFLRRLWDTSLGESPRKNVALLGSRTNSSKKHVPMDAITMLVGGDWNHIIFLVNLWLIYG